MHMFDNNNENNGSITSDAQVEELRNKLQECQSDVEMWKDKLFRVTADFQNFKRRTEKEQALWMQTAQTDILQNLLPIVDDIDRAVVESAKQEQSPEFKVWIEGLSMISVSLYKFLKKSGVEEITQLTHFDPTLHEALAAVQIPGKQEGDIVEVLQKGFMLKGEVLRPAKVAVAK